MPPGGTLQCLRQRSSPHQAGWQALAEACDHQRLVTPQWVSTRHSPSCPLRPGRGRGTGPCPPELCRAHHRHPPPPFLLRGFRPSPQACASVSWSEACGEHTNHLPGLQETHMPHPPGHFFTSLGSWPSWVLTLHASTHSALKLPSEAGAAHISFYREGNRGLGT